MNAVLLRLSLAAGAVLAMAAFILGWLRGASVPVALYRSAIVMLIGSMIVAVFFRHFTLVLYNFVAQRMAEEARRQPGPPAGDGAPRAPERGRADK